MSVDVLDVCIISSRSGNNTLYLITRLCISFFSLSED